MSGYPTNQALGAGFCLPSCCCYRSNQIVKPPELLRKYSGLNVAVPEQTKEETQPRSKGQNQPELVQLLIGTLTGVVLVLVVGYELKIFPNRKRATCVQRGRTPFLILTLVEGLDADVWRGMIRIDCKPLLECQSVAIAPGELPTLPIQVRAVLVGNQYLGLHGKVRGELQTYPVFGRGIWRG